MSMGQRGRPPEPATLRILKGETRPSQIARAPKPQDPPSIPKDLNAAAKAVWTRVLTATALTAHIGASHAETFRHYCETTAEMDAMKPKGTKEWRELANLHRQLARELCLTPATGAALRGREMGTERKLDKYRAG